MRVNLKGLHSVKAPRGKGLYHYAWRKGPRIKTEAEPGTPEFMQAYNEAVASAKPQATGLFDEVIRIYEGSGEFAKLADRSKSDYKKIIAKIRKRFGTLPKMALEAKATRGLFKQWRDELAKKSLRQADYHWSILQRICSIGKDRGAISTNPCEKGGRLYEADRTDIIWTPDHISRLLGYLQAKASHLILPFMIALWTGQREGDILRLPWSAYDGKYLYVRQSKGKSRVRIPVGAPLKELLDSTKRTGLLICMTSRKTAWTLGGFGSSWGKANDRAGIDDVTFHDLRGTAVTRLAIASATVPEIATITGHSLADVEAILDAHYLGRTVELAESAMLKLESKYQTLEMAAQ